MLPALLGRALRAARDSGAGERAALEALLAHELAVLDTLVSGAALT